MTQTQSNTNQLFELGRLYADKGDFNLAIPKLEEAADLFFEARQFSEYLKALNLLLRVYAEKGLNDQVHKIKEKLQDLVLKEGFELNAKTYYTLAICTAYKNQHDVALDYLQKSLAIALANDDKEDICYAINGLAICYNRLGKKSEALKELYNLQVFFQVLDIPDIKISSMILNAKILAELKKFDQAIEIIWQAYDMVRSRKVMTMYIYLLHNMGSIYLEAGDKEMARVYLNLAKKSVDPDNMVVLSKAIEEDLKQVGGDSKANYDLVFELENHSVIEKKLGRIDFKNQFILLDLLKLFVQNQGTVYSKEYLVENIWRQSYDPSVHDNKIYVTIKRLRKMIEPDYDKPKYIFRAKNGYFMNKSARVLVDQKEGGIQ